MRELYNGILESEQASIIQPEGVRKVPIKVKLARLYATVYFCRKLVLAPIVVLMDSNNVFATKIYILIVLQFLYI